MWGRERAGHARYARGKEGRSDVRAQSGYMHYMSHCCTVGAQAEGKALLLAL
jgi:hypothetical protein